MHRPCTSCSRRLPEHCFPMAGGKRRGICSACNNDQQRARSPLAPIKADPVQIKLNNLCCILFGPVQRNQPLRSAA